MCLIAYENVFLVRTVFERVAARIPGCSPSLENLARWLEQHHSQFTSGSIEDEANSRRYDYFHTAVVLTIAHAGAKQRPETVGGRTMYAADSLPTTLKVVIAESRTNHKQEGSRCAL